MIMQIQKLREMAGLTQVQVALRMGVSQNTVSQWENEVALPKSRDLPQLARVLQCEIGELYVPEGDGGEAWEPA